MDTIKKKLLTLIQLLLVGVIIFSSVKIYSYWQDLKQTDSIEAESRDMVQDVRKDIAEVVQDDTSEAVQDDASEVREDVESISLSFIDELKKTYPEAIGHIEIDDTRISYPIVQHEDNDFYLNHSPDKSENANGSIFLDYRNSPKLDDDNNIAYGHYIRSGKLFHNLYKFREQEFYNKVDTIELQTLEGPKIYKIFSAYDTDPSFQYRYVNYPDKDEKIDFIEEIVDRSLIDSGDTKELLDEDSKILTLSTCSNKGSTRLVVHGVEVTD